MNKYKVSILKKSGAVSDYIITTRWRTCAEEHAQVLCDICDGKQILSIIRL